MVVIYKLLLILSTDFGIASGWIFDVLRKDNQRVAVK